MVTDGPWRSRRAHKEGEPVGRRPATLRDTRRVPGPPRPGDADFRQVLGRFPTGVVVVTALAGGEPVGLSVNSFTAVSLQPALVAFCIARTSGTWAAMRPTGVFCANVLAEDQEALSRRFARPGTGRFAGVGWEVSPSGAARLHGVLAWVDCTIEAVHGGGDHEICVGRVQALDVERQDGPLVYFRGGYGRFEA